MTPNEFFDFEPPTPLYLGTPLGAGVGGGIKSFLCIVAGVRQFGPRSWTNFFVDRPPINGRVPDPPGNAPPPPPPTTGPCQLLSDLHVLPEKFKNSHFSPNPYVAPGMGLGDHLVTIWVFEHPWGPL